MKAFLLIVALGYEVYSQALPRELQLFVTYRDFLPIQCLEGIDKADETNFLVDGGAEAAAAAWGVTDLTLSSGNRDGCHQYLDTNNADSILFREALINGEIKGHPDFDAQGQFVVSANCDEVDPDTQLNFPVGSCLIQDNPLASIVSNELIVGANGLPQVQYCVEDPEGRCGFYTRNDGLRQTQTQKKFFDQWFNDDASVNKRVGQRFQLDLVNETIGLYEFVDAINKSDATDFPEDINLFVSAAGAESPVFGPLDRFRKNGTREVKVGEVTVEDAPAWPRHTDDDDITAEIAYSFTSEVHTTFEFRNDSTMIFNFSGDDDFWAFINGQLAVDVGGMHGKRTKVIDLNAGSNITTFAELLGLENRQVYTLDIFHAERQRTGSNFDIQTTLFAACNVLQSGSFSFDLASSLNEEQFEDLFEAQGVTLFNDRSFQIMSKEQQFSGTHIFTRIQENLQPGFNAKFLARIDGSTEGFAFVVQSQGIEDYPRRTGRTFNFEGLTSSFAVLFDLCTVRDENNNCAGQEVRLHFPNDSQEGNSPESVLPENNGTLRVHDRVLRSLVKNEAFPVEISFFGDAPDFLEVYINNSLYIRQSGFSVEDIIGSAGAHVGFTAGSTDKAGDIFIEDFSFSVVAVDPSRTQSSIEQPSNESVIADGVSATEGFVIFTEDLCTNPFLSGTQEALISAVYFSAPFLVEQEEETGRRTQDEDPVLVDAKIQDNLDGTYNLQLQTEEVGDFLLAVAFGEGCEVQFSTLTEDVVIDNVTFTQITFEPSLLAVDPTFCSFLSFDEPVVALSVPTSAPIALEEAGDVDEVNIVPFLGAGGGLCCIIMILAVVLVAYRAKWQREKGFIKAGTAYKLEVNTVIADGDVYTATGQAVLESQKEILALKAAAEHDQRTAEINNLKSENEEMKEIIKVAKTDNATSNVANGVYIKAKKKPKKKRLDF